MKDAHVASPAYSLPLAFCNTETKFKVFTGLTRVLYDPLLAGVISNVASHHPPPSCPRALHTGLCAAPWTTSGPSRWLVIQGSHLKHRFPRENPTGPPVKIITPLILADHRCKLFRSLLEFEGLFLHISNFRFVVPPYEGRLYGDEDPV